ncbi:uncharacterized protein LOC131027864 isoform X3 [Cryptomeria japonica]|uniref:uncharacterized protein LOC131027864 isoform X3 n=1 Tax=Cryptomeria japonica TaxID=3369 RepID=UPI0025ACCA4B|nr:uncharacterized protein LOC131027864 isoform X3 [Cryptomeria japonica]
MEISMDETHVSLKSKQQSFFACYLLCSLSSRYKGCTYIGFTVNPRRRIRQHNGEIKSGARKTKRKRPWEMILCIYGFPSQVSALQFEWAWQHPRESLAVKEAAKGMKLGGTAGKIRLAYTMLTLPEWKSLNLTINFLSTKYVGNTKGCPILPSHMKVQFCPVDELPCYTDDWVSDPEDDLKEECYLGKSDASDPEEEMEVDKGPALMKQHTEIKKQQQQECDQNPAKKCRRRGRPLKQYKCNSDELASEVTVPSPSKLSSFSVLAGAESEGLDRLNSFFPNSFSSDQLASKVTVPSPSKLSSFSVLAGAESEGLDRLNSFFPNSDCLLQISDSENSEDGYVANGTSVMPNTSLPVNLSQEASTAVKNNCSINFRADYSPSNVSDSDKLKGISDEFSIKRKMIAASDPVEYNLSNELKMDYSVSKDSEVDKIVNNMDDFSIKSRTTSLNMIEFPSLQEYSPVCYISPLKMSEEALLSFTSPSKSPPTKKLISVSCTFLSPISSQRQVITVLSTPRPISKNVIDLTDSPAT